MFVCLALWNPIEFYNKLGLFSDKKYILYSSIIMFFILK